MLTWIIEKDVFANKQFDAMCGAVCAQGHRLEVVRVIPFIHEIEGKVPVIDGPAVVYGSIGVAKLAEKHNWNPGVFTGKFEYSNYCDKVGNLMLNPDARVMKLSEVNEIGEFFIKPNDDNKAFAGTVIHGEEFEEWLNNLRHIGYLDDSDFDVVVSSKKNLAMEWRSIVVGGEIVESSIYRQWQSVMPERNRNADVDALIMQAHELFEPAPVYVVDVAQTEEGLRIVEYNTFNSAGFYACDPARVVEAVSNLILD